MYTYHMHGQRASAVFSAGLFGLSPCERIEIWLNLQLVNSTPYPNRVNCPNHVDKVLVEWAL
jgi:hypothetical protein